MTGSLKHQQTIRVLQGGDIMAEWGPMRLVISSFVGRVPQREMNVDAARYAFEALEKISRHREKLSRASAHIPNQIEEPLALEMVCSALTVGDADLTPMAAVAGTIADAVADYLAGRGMTKAIVNNGGDIAIRLRGENSATVGIREDVRSYDFSHVIRLGSERASWGVATSGVGGRSLTRGIASAATVIAHKASMADAAATAVANASFVEDRQVIQKDAERVAPDTDIPGTPITCKVGLLKEETKSLAVKRALGRAAELMAREVILGAFVSVAGKVGMTDAFRGWLVDEFPDKRKLLTPKP
ncbi:MAG: FAD:protein FMN transferase [Candidatus Desulfacyla sp.]